MFAGDANDPTLGCDLEPPSFDQKTINETAEWSGVARVAGTSEPDARGLLNEEIGRLDWIGVYCI